MTASRLHRLTTVCLALLYGLVGVSGESLHYLVTDPAAIWSVAPPERTVVYYHTHGPDHHGHFHRHVHHGDHSHTSVPAARGEQEEERHLAFTTEHITHEPHACPLLTLVSTLKLGNVGEPTILIIDTFETPNIEFNRFAESSLAFSWSARGPPGIYLA
jgi:hypothetical protein